MRKYILLSLTVIVTIFLVYGIVYKFGFLGFLFVWMLNFVLMMCVFFFTETLKSEFKSDYYLEKSWEKKVKIYEAFGINWFRKLLVIIGWEKLNKKANTVEKNLQALVHLEYRTKQSELGHIIIFFIVLAFTIYVAITFGIKESVSLIILNILLNLYPVLLQRYNRPRLQKAIILSKYREERRYL